MKKTMIYAVISGLLLSSGMAFAETIQSEQPETPPAKNCTKDIKKHHPQRMNLDERLKLTEEQKKQAHEIRMEGHQKMKPVMEKMKAKKMEAKSIKENTKLSQEAKDKKLAAVKSDIRKLKEQARKIRQENTKEFEAILTDEQKAEFEKIKQEGRERFKKEHKGKHPKGHGCYKGSQAQK